MKPIFQLAHEHLRRLEPYIPGLQPSGTGWVKLNTNELPFAPPADVGEAMAAEFGRLARYPDPRSEPLRRALAAHHGVNVNQVIIGNGSDDILNLLARAFGGAGRRTVDTFPSYSLYPILTTMAGGQPISVPLNEDFSLPVEALATSGADLVFLTCPNAPTGIRFPMADLESLAGSLQGLLVIDEAYVDFAEESALPLLKTHENVVLTRTFSKAYGLAGLRVGYGLAAPAVISILDRVRDSYNVNRLSQAGALAALRSQGVYRGYIEEIKHTRDWVRQSLEDMGWHVCPSESNFLFVEPVDVEGQHGAGVAANLFKHLEARRILVRYFPSHPLTASRLRVSVGTRMEMEQFLEGVTSWRQPA